MPLRIVVPPRVAHAPTRVDARLRVDARGALTLTLDAQERVVGVALGQGAFATAYALGAEALRLTHHHPPDVLRRELRGLGIMRACAGPGVLRVVRRGAFDGAWGPGVYALLERFDVELFNALVDIDALRGGNATTAPPPPDEGALRAFALRLVSAVQRVHERGFVHHDIKPSNVGLRGGLDDPVLFDFGFAARRRDDDAWLRGSVAYRAPEVFGATQGSPLPPDFDPTTKDVYALGRTLLSTIYVVRRRPGGDWFLWDREERDVGRARAWYATFEACRLERLKATTDRLERVALTMVARDGRPSLAEVLTSVRDEEE